MTTVKSGNLCKHGQKIIVTQETVSTVATLIPSTEIEINRASSEVTDSGFASTEPSGRTVRSGQRILGKTRGVHINTVTGSSYLDQGIILWKIIKYYTNRSEILNI